MSGFSLLARYRRPNGRKTLEDLEFLIAAIHVQNDRLDKIMTVIEETRHADPLDVIDSTKDKTDDAVERGNP